MKLSKQAAASDNVKYVAGDTVKVTSGDLQNLQGTVERVDPDGQVVLKPALDDFTELIRFPASQLAKHFERGKHVKVSVSSISQPVHFTAACHGGFFPLPGQTPVQV